MVFFLKIVYTFATVLGALCSFQELFQGLKGNPVQIGNCPRNCKFHPYISSTWPLVFGKAGNVETSQETCPGLSLFVFYGG